MRKDDDRMEQAQQDREPRRTASLRNYMLAKQEVVAAVRDAKRLFQERDIPEAYSRCQELLVQLAEDRFNLAVVGQFKRGKSTLMNAVLGRDLLPTGLLPLTSAITTLCYGPAERVVLRRQGWTLEQEIPVAQLASFITERGNPGNEKGLIEARVELPLPFLRRGLHFIDTPGIGSASRANTATTYAFLPQMHAVIFVTSVDAPLSEAEEHFLLDIRAQVRQLFIVVNKIDLLGSPEREDVLRYIQDRVARLLGTAEVHLFPLSARDGLEAKRSHNVSGMQHSGLAAFEQALTTFLTEVQGRAFLVSILDHTLRLFPGADSTPVMTRPGERSQTSGNLLDVQHTLQALRTALLAGTSLPELSGKGKPVTADTQVIEQALAASHPSFQRDGSESPRSRKQTCAICAAQGEALFAFFAKWQYLLATDDAAQRAFASEHGLCAVHTWQFQEMASPQGISEGYAPLVETLTTDLAHLSQQQASHAATPLTALLAHSTTCAACRLLRDVAAEQAAQFLAHVTTSEGREQYISSSMMLCLPHLQGVLACLEQKNNEVDEKHTLAAFLLREQARRFEELAEDLRSYTLKRDALRRGLLNREEAGAWRRALTLLVGDRTVRGGAFMTDADRA